MSRKSFQFISNYLTYSIVILKKNWTLNMNKQTFVEHIYACICTNRTNLCLHQVTKWMSRANLYWVKDGMVFIHEVFNVTHSRRRLDHLTCYSTYYYCTWVPLVHLYHSLQFSIGTWQLAGNCKCMTKKYINRNHCFILTARSQRLCTLVAA